jgi:hypothetical protein
MGSQNFYDFLIKSGINPEIILTHCEEAMSLEKELIRYLKNNSKKVIDVKKNILYASSESELISKTNEEIENRSNVVKNLSKFISFMKKEDKRYLETIQSDKFHDWIEKKSNFKKTYFDQISCIPAYIKEKSNIFIFGLLIEFKIIIDLLISNIEVIVEDNSVSNNGEVNGVLIKKYYQFLDDCEKDALIHYIFAYQDFYNLAKIISKEIIELQNPIEY